ncbi:MAG: histone deacetylase [Gemmatimonadetes bacterium]|nr:histone deacetylase [Gemmatimonadota bacterium]
MPLHCWTSARYEIPLPDGHRFPIAKYALLRDRVCAEGLVEPSHLHEPERSSVADLSRVHAPSYIDRILHGGLEASEVRRLGFPWSAALAERSLRAVGGTLAAAQQSLRSGIAMNLAGGTHHAFADHGEGYCVFNDVAVATRALQAEALVRRVAIVDLDVHQGNGTHAIFTGDPDVFTFSMHGARNYPFRKVAGMVDVELADGTGDDEYLEVLGRHLPAVLARAQPDLVFYLAGADPHEGDRLGRLALTHEGLARRDHMVLTACRDVGIPVAITIAGGYGRDVATTVEAHVRTVRLARDVLLASAR